MAQILCTLCDRNYLARAIVMVRSLHSNWNSQPLPSVYLLCLDQESLDYLRRNPEPGIIPIPLSELEAFDPELYAVRNNRSRIEYYFTLSPCFPRYLFHRLQVDSIISCDADLYFFNDVSRAFEFLQQSPIFITAHGFAPRVIAQGRGTGMFNVSFQGFRNDLVGTACLEQWRRQCLDWCLHKIDNANQRYADQRYLDSWPTDFADKIQILNPPEWGLAPWNLGRFQLGLTDHRPTVENHPLRFFHFHGIRWITPTIAADRLWVYHYKPTSVVLEHIYAPYLVALSKAEQDVRQGIPSMQILTDKSQIDISLAWKLWQARTACQIDSSNGCIRRHILTALHPIGYSLSLARCLLTRICPPA